MLEVLRSGRLSLGPAGPRFEELLAAPSARLRSRRLVGHRRPAPLHAPRRDRPGDEVITSPYSFAPSANCVIYEGATPVFADIDPRTLNLDPARSGAAITPRDTGHRRRRHLRLPLRARPAHERSADGTGCLLVEDACEALGARYKGRTARLARAPGRLRLLPQQADHHRRGRRGHDRLGGAELLVSLLATRAALETSSWLSTAARLQLPPRRPPAALGIGQLESSTGSSPRGEVARATTSCCDLEVELPLPDDEDTSAPGSSTSSPARRRDRDRVMATAAEGIACAALPALDPPPVLHARALRLRRGAVPRSEDAERRTMALPFHARLRAPTPGAGRRGVLLPRSRPPEP